MKMPLAFSCCMVVSHWEPCRFHDGMGIPTPTSDVRLPAEKTKEAAMASGGTEMRANLSGMVALMPGLA